MLDAEGTVTATTRFEGDGQFFTITIDLNTPSGGELRLSEFDPMYQFHKVELNGQPTTVTEENSLVLSNGRNRIVLGYRHRTLQFDPALWEQVALIDNNRTNFVLVADRGVNYVVNPANNAMNTQLGFERGTASMLLDFIRQYDTENGILDDLELPMFAKEKPEGYDGWTVMFNEKPELLEGRVSIDAGYRTISIEGPTQGKMREAMVVFMRLVDRKYPHVGRFHPFRDRKAAWKNDGKVPFEKWVIRKPTREFYEAFEDKLFIARPILNEQYEHLYADGRMDFAGQYQMRWTPNLIEPTFGERFLYGYSGQGRSFTKAELQRNADPIKD